MRLSRRLSRRQAVAGLGAVALLPTAVQGAVPNIAGRRPNFLFIMADDLGYADLSCYGRRDFATPALDRLAAGGMRFTDAYANSAVCSATRTALITGRYQYRLPVGLEEPIATRDVGLPPAHPTLPSLLRRAGYATSLIGKWHLGSLPAYGPLQSGYDEFWGFRGGGVDYFTHANAGRHDLWDGDHEVHETGYLTDLLGDRAVAQLGGYARGGQPFLMSLHFSAPHWPWESETDQAESVRLAQRGTDPVAPLDFDGGTRKTYARMVQRLDFQVGRVLERLDRLGLAEDTIVVFTSDNGGERFADVWPFSGRKTELLEGGIRVPAIVRWPRQVAAGRTSAARIMSMDWLPTFLAAANVAPDPAFAPDGISILPALAGRALPDRALFWRYKFNAQQACRVGDWKYLKIAENSFLFNVADDPLERANHKDRRPDLFAAMKARWVAWDAEMLPLDPQSFSHGFTSAQMADRMGMSDHGHVGTTGN